MALRTVVVDIEGTTSSTGFVVDTLYPYAYARFDRWLAEHPDDPDAQRALAQVREAAGDPSLDVAGAVAQLRAWSDADVKSTPLKTLQGRLWAEGFAAGELTSHFFDDAIPALRRWHADGLRLVIFSSGSLTAQRTWFGHTPEGDLLPLLSAHFDTENAGPKRVASSYRKIAAELGEDPEAIVFLSDLPAELDAAREAGWHTVGVRREGEPYAAGGVGDHLEVTSFDQLDLSGDGPARR